MPNYSGIFLKGLFEIMEENVGQINLAFEACTSEDTTKFDQGMFLSSKYCCTLTLNRFEYDGIIQIIQIFCV